MKKLPAFLRQSLTYDSGTEMTCHVELAKQMNLDIWFAGRRAVKRIRNLRHWGCD